MANNTAQAGPAIAPPLLIGVCIIGAVFVVIVTAALYKLCRRANAESDQDVEVKAWNPNQRGIEQTRYMEEVRMRNRMFAWDRSRAGRPERYEREWLENPYNAKAVSVEEYLDDITLNDNPYEGVVDECIKRQSQQVFMQSPGRPCGPSQDDFVQAGPDVAFPERAIPQGVDLSHFNNSGVKITVNDGNGDIANVEMRHNSKWPPRQSRMFRSSSIYSGDVLLPSTHLHLVQSSSNYAFGRNGKSHDGGCSLEIGQTNSTQV